ncbi:low molecular weight protein arginine phosphatase [Clostridium grantii]|uniref:Protein-tyrosine phosphatase n=1 Tax=Clostridium grantii DSM 8605 TaxID=1121316 RepID=A0A1M5TJX9_9CLOT|nr:low molecular weight protein arginine phosphatase [Clostridium grantii]SHH50970.1 protein-tyrosine phosphatase [Clostridium grantii DSM 8605]
MQLLFVCTGNTCRSVMAEAIFKELSKEKGLNAKAISAGISPIPGSLATKNASNLILRRFNLDFSEREAVKLKDEHLDNSFLILTMTEYIAEILKNKYPHIEKKVFTIKEFLGEKGDIIDPFGENIVVYEETFDILLEKIDKIIDKIAYIS